MAKTQIPGSMLLDGSVANADLATDAAIAVSKLAGSASTIVGQKATGGVVNLTAAEAKAILSLGNVDNTSDATKNSAVATLTNKRTQPRAYSTTSLATLTPEKDSYDAFELTAQAEALTIANHSSSTVANFEQIKISITDNGTPRALSFGTNYVAGTDLALPTTTIAGKELELMFEWRTAISKYRLMAIWRQL